MLAVALSKIIVPQTEEIDNTLQISKEKIGRNILDAISNGTSTENFSSKAITSSTVSSESAPRSSMNLAVEVTFSGSTPS